MKEIIENLKQEEKKAEKRLANIKLLINLSESAKAVMESFAKINKISFEEKQKNIDEEWVKHLKEKGFITNEGYWVRDASKTKEAIDKAW